MDNDKFADLLDAEFQALRIGLKTLTACVSAQMPNGEVAEAFEGAVEELKNHPDAPERTVEYLTQMAEVARKAVSKQ